MFVFHETYVFLDIISITYETSSYSSHEGRSPIFAKLSK